jgi:hypothetical protein
MAVVSKLRVYWKRRLERPIMRPLALAGPILVLLVALPLLRPLRHPDPAEVSNDETLRLASIRALVEHRSLALDHGYAKLPGAVQTTSGTYSAQPPMMAVLLSAPAYALTWMGYSFDDNQLLIAYLLTVIGVTLPVAGAAGLVYRMGRLFELRRPWRALLGIAVVAGSGLLSYSVVLNAHAPAAVLVIASAASLIHIAAVDRRRRQIGWFAVAGGCAALATTLDPAAGVMLLLFVAVIPAMRLSIPRRLLGVFLYVLGATPIIAVHAAWNFPITGDMIPASMHQTFIANSSVSPVVGAGDEFLDDEPAAVKTMWDALGAHLVWFVQATLGEHGLFSHYPILIVGIVGIMAVMHRHWPSSTKILAAATGVGALTIMWCYRYSRLDWTAAMYGTQWFIVFMPLLLFWGGAWLRRSHRPRSWAIAGAFLAYSVAVGVLGATGPLPRHGFDRYTPAEAWARLTQPTTTSVGGVLAGPNP